MKKAAATLAGRWLVVFGAGLMIASSISAQPAPSVDGPASEWVILGTASGPNSEATRAQPANALLAGLLAAAAPAMRAGYGIPGQSWSVAIDVVELSDGSTATVDGFAVTVAENSHFSLPEGAEDPAEGVSLSYRFDLADRSIVYTGDSGPSEALVQLARGADLLVSEMIDVDAVLAAMRPPGTPPVNSGQPGFEWHMRAHHMTPVQVGELAAAATVGQVVITHFAPNPTRPEQAQAYLDAIAENFAGAAEFASDLKRY